MKKLYASAMTLLATAGTALANPDGCGPFGDNCPVSVPEISALEGTAALAAVAAMLLLVWERRRRAA